MFLLSIKFVQTSKRLYRENTGNRLITFSCSIFYSKFYKWKDILSRHEGSLIGLISFLRSAESFTYSLYKEHSNKEVINIGIRFL